MKNLILRVVIFLLVSVPFMGCSQDQSPIPPDSVESLSITQLFDHRNREDASKLLNCLIPREDISDYYQGLYVY